MDHGFPCGPRSCDAVPDDSNPPRLDHHARQESREWTVLAPSPDRSRNQAAGEPGGLSRELDVSAGGNRARGNLSSVAGAEPLAGAVPGESRRFSAALPRPTVVA